MEHMKSSWFKMLSEEKNKMNTTDLEFSALASWVLDCQESFQRIYKELLPKIDNIDPIEKDALHDVVFDIYFELKHIGNHINDSENGFLALLKALSGN